MMRLTCPAYRAVTRSYLERKVPCVGMSESLEVTETVVRAVTEPYHDHVFCGDTTFLVRDTKPVGCNIGDIYMYIPGY